jgi:hypothetical protein
MTWCLFIGRKSCDRHAMEHVHKRRFNKIACSPKQAPLKSCIDRSPNCSAGNIATSYGARFLLHEIRCGKLPDVSLCKQTETNAHPGSF